MMLNKLGLVGLADKQRIDNAEIDAFLLGLEQLLSESNMDMPLFYRSLVDLDFTSLTSTDYLIDFFSAPSLRNDADTTNSKVAAVVKPISSILWC